MMSSTHQIQQSKGKEDPQQGYCGAVPSELREARNASPTLSEEQARQYAEWFKVLADSTRLRILNLLAQNAEPLCVCDIVDYFDLGQPTISHHLKILRDSCFVKTERRANFIYYSINRECIFSLPQAARLIMGI